MLARCMRLSLSRRGALLVENEADRLWVEGGWPLPDARVGVLPGAGVNPGVYMPAPEPQGPVVVGVACRLVRSKGVDVAVEAIRRLRETGADIVLRIAGKPDTDNPERVDELTIAQWRTQAGVEWHGATADMNAFWAQVHIACAPSRGGEGLPRSLLEAAACGRPLVASAVPGCADFVDASVGLLVPASDPAALAEAIARLAADAGLRQAMGRAARDKIIAGYTEAHVADCAARIWAGARA